MCFTTERGRGCYSISSELQDWEIDTSGQSGIQHVVPAAALRALAYGKPALYGNDKRTWWHAGFGYIWALGAAIKVHVFHELIEISPRAKMAI